ncbi:N-acetylmuramoyl-L-alanine amidase [bacterium]|nr:N-acetylmuramoyl-L-alanine amidase [bacterium]
MNKKGIGICLVGNYSRGDVSGKQMESLVYLINMLREYYNIPKQNIMGHGQVPNAATECPGLKFPWEEFWSGLDSAE